MHRLAAGLPLKKVDYATHKVDYAGKGQRIFDGIVKNLKFLGADGQILTAGKSGKIPPGQIRGNGTGSTPEKFQYFYHPDFPIAIGIGSTSYVTDASGEVYQHLEYMAFGETFVEEHSNTDRTPYLFNGKELDEETGLYYYGAMYYDASTSVWQSIDPKSDKYPGLSPYNYTFNNPIVYIDPDGRDGILIVFPDYKVDTESRFGKQPLGHAGVLIIDNKTGLTKYYEYGRYTTKDGTKGLVRNVKVPNVEIGKDGKPTPKSLSKVLGVISKNSGQGGVIEGAYIQSDEFDKMNDYAKGKFNESNPGNNDYNKNRDPYDLLSNNCGTFASDVLSQDEAVKDKAPGIIIPTPDNIASEYRGTFDKVDYDPKSGRGTMTPTKTLGQKVKEFFKSYNE